MQKLRRRGTWIAMAVCLAVLASACYSWNTMSYDPGKALKVDWYAAIPVEQGHLTACVAQRWKNPDGTVNDGWQCRSVWGAEGKGDPGNWHIDPGGPDDPGNQGILSVKGSGTSAGGAMLVMEDGRIFEGCEWVSPNNTYNCDYQSKYWSAPFKTTQGYNYLRATIDWGNYVVDALACAGGLTGTLMYGQTWTLPALKDCSSGPL